MGKPDTRHYLVKAIEAIAERVPGNLGDHAAARQLQAELNRIRLGAEALDRANANRSPLDTPAAHALKIAKMARTLGTQITAAMNRSGGITKQAFEDVERRRAEKVNMQPDAFASEIRTAFRELKTAEKMKLIDRLVEENRGPELAAIVDAPSVLTGLADEHRAVFKTAIYAKHASAELEECQGLEEAFEATMHGFTAASRLEKELTDPNKLAEIERGAAAAEAAGVAFDQSLQ